MGAAVLKENGLALDPAQCNACGRCVGKCPFGAVQGSESTYLITIGGRWGKQVRHGSPLQRRLNEQQAMDMIEKCILLFKRDGFGRAVWLHDRPHRVAKGGGAAVHRRTARTKGPDPGH